VFKLMFYFSASIIPLALPLSILLASIMTFGNLGETYELIAAKAQGFRSGAFSGPCLSSFLP